MRVVGLKGLFSSFGLCSKLNDTFAMENYRVSVVIGVVEKIVQVV